MKHTLTFERDLYEFWCEHCPSQFRTENRDEYDGIPFDVADVISDAVDEYRESQEGM